MKSKYYIINGNFWYIHNIYIILKRHDFVYFNNTELYCFDKIKYFCDINVLNDAKKKLFLGQN